VINVEQSKNISKDENIPIKQYVNPQGYIKISSTGSAHIPRDMIEYLELVEKTEIRIPWIWGNNIIILYNENSTFENILTSLRRVEARIEGIFSAHNEEDENKNLLERVKQYIMSGRIDLAKEALGLH